MPDPSTATIPGLRVAVTMPFVRSCSQCVALAEGAAVAAVRDGSVTSFSLQPGKTHAHPVANGKAETALPAAGAALDGQKPLFAPAEPRSDTNGHNFLDPPGREG
jgi:hypothetical protein